MHSNFEEWIGDSDYKFTNGQVLKLKNYYIIIIFKPYI